MPSPVSWSLPFLWRLFFSLVPSRADSLSSFFRHSDLINPCSYPSPPHQDFFARCRITDNKVHRYNICDPESSISMSEAIEIVEELDQIYLAKSGFCICDNPAIPEDCWYQFGFAFLKHLPLPIRPFPLSVDSHVCSKNQSFIHSAPLNIISRSDVEKYGKVFVKILRERWSMGSCGEDILFLIIKHRPTQLSSQEGDRKPLIFVDEGDAVSSRLAHIISRDSRARLLHDLNQNLQIGFTLKVVYERLLLQYVKWLERADASYYSPKQRNHIPQWALLSFGGCVVLLAVMALGYCLVRTRVRRGASRGKPGGEGSRRWKAGFVGVLGVLMGGSQKGKGGAATTALL